MTRRPSLHRTLWFMDDYKAMADVLQETAYRLRELREGWDMSIEELAGASGMSAETIECFEGLGADSRGLRLKQAGFVDPPSVNADQPKELSKRAEHYKALACLIEEAAHILKEMPEGWGVLTEIICRASGVDPRFIERAGRIGSARSIVLHRRKRRAIQNGNEESHEHH